MCGVGGVWRRHGGRAERAWLDRMMSAMAHRGPEGSSFAQVREDVALAFLSLAFTEQPATGLQPIYSADHRVALLYNGEIYDYEALRDDLRARGHAFHTRSDSEVVLRLYEEYGEGMFAHMNGEFAFAIWDGRRDELWLARDRFGIKPMFFAEHDGAFVFASECKGLLALPGFPVAIDPRFFAGPGMGLADCARTAFAGITAVRPAHLTKVTRDGLTTAPYWTPDFTRVPGRTFDEAKAQLDEALTRAVQRRVGGDVPIAMALSSGLDSSTVAALTKRAGRTLTCFSISYPGQPYDEGAEAERTAKRLGLPWVGVECDAASLADGYLASIRSTEVASASLSSVSRIAVMRGVRDAGFKAVCSGETSDEQFGGYPYFRLEALWRDLAAGAPSARQHLKDFSRTEGKARGVFWTQTDPPAELDPRFGYASAYALRVATAQRQLPRLLSKRVIAELGDDGPSSTVDREFAPFDLPSMDPFDATRVVSKAVFSGIIVPLLGDRVEMANSLEGRAPFQDLDVMNLTWSLPAEHCLVPDSALSKRLLRSLAEPLLGPEYQRPTKHNLLSPSFRDFRATPVGREVMDTLMSPAAIERADLLNPTTVRLVRAAWPLAPRGSHAFRRLDALWGYMMGIQGLHHVFVDGAVPAGPVIPLETDRSPATLTEAAP